MLDPLTAVVQSLRWHLVSGGGEQVEDETPYLSLATATAQPRLIKVVLCKGYTRSRRVMLRAVVEPAICGV